MDEDDEESRDGEKGDENPRDEEAGDEDTRKEKKDEKLWMKMMKKHSTKSM
jgi:hypothetical protein